ncbi:MAG: methionyl-tRNA formyltransferase [Candidatus Campbellbacteria bacterium]
MTNPFRFVFFGTPDIAVVSLQTLHDAGMIPSLIVTAPDTKKGRGMLLTPSDAAQWAHAHGVPVLKPVKLSEESVVENIRAVGADLFIVVAYGKIIPQALLDIPKHGALNMHPSLLPKHRGPSPIESQILSETNARNVGVSVMLLDEKMDHGPVLAQESVVDELPEWPVTASRLRALAARRGAHLLTRSIAPYLSGTLTPVPQDDTAATYCSMITKDDARIDLSDDPIKNYRAILAYDIWPRAYFFAEKNGARVRVVVTSARIENDALILERVIPEGRKEMAYEDFLR